MSLKDDLKAGQNCNSKGYYDSYKDNIYKQTMPLHYQDMFDHGSGGEIHSKAEAVHSSSMLSYNLLHWIDINNPFEFNGVVYTKVYFEVQMRTLSCRCNPANMDVVLEGTQIGSPKKHLLFVESKFTEYLENNKFNLSDSYNKNNNWYNNNIDWEKVLSQTQDVLKKQKGYGEGIKQAITHLYGILGLWNKDALNWFNKNNGNLSISDINNVDIEFANFIYEPDDNRFKEEHNAYENYQKLYGNFLNSISNELPTQLIPKWYSYSDLWKQLKRQINDKDLIDFIERRYMQFAE